MHAQTTAEVIRLPVRLRVVSVQSAPKSSMPGKSATALDRLLEDGILDVRQHAAALAYAALRSRHEDGLLLVRFRRYPASDEAWQAVKRDHARLIRAAGAERYVLDRLCLEDDAPLSSEVERVRAALERVAYRCLPDYGDARGSGSWSSA